MRSERDRPDGLRRRQVLKGALVLGGVGVLRTIGAASAEGASAAHAASAAFTVRRVGVGYEARATYQDGPTFSDPGDVGAVINDAIQAILDRHMLGGAIELPMEQNLIAQTPIEINAPGKLVRIMGQGPRATVLNWQGTGPCIRVRGTTLNLWNGGHAILRDFQISRGQASGPSTGIDISDGRGVSSIENVALINLETGLRASHVAALGASNLYVEKCGTAVSFEGGETDVVCNDIDLFSPTLIKNGVGMKLLGKCNGVRVHGGNIERNRVAEVEVRVRNPAYQGPAESLRSILFKGTWFEAGVAPSNPLGAAVILAGEEGAPIEAAGFESCSFVGGGYRVGIAAEHARHTLVDHTFFSGFRGDGVAPVRTTNTCKGTVVRNSVRDPLDEPHDLHGAGDFVDVGLREGPGAPRLEQWAQRERGMWLDTTGQRVYDVFRLGVDLHLVERLT